MQCKFPDRSYIAAFTTQFNLLEERLKAMGTPMLDLSPDACFVLRTPLGEEIVLKDRNMPLLQYDAPPGTHSSVRPVLVARCHSHARVHTHARL
jgi:hypothetical protein